MLFLLSIKSKLTSGCVDECVLLPRWPSILLLQSRTFVEQRKYIGHLGERKHNFRPRCVWFAHTTRQKRRRIELLLLLLLYVYVPPSFVSRTVACALANSAICQWNGRRRFILLRKQISLLFILSLDVADAAIAPLNHDVSYIDTF